MTLLWFVFALAFADVPSTPDSGCRCAVATPLAAAPLLVAAALPALARRRR